jgi:hypothetical protein
MQDIPIFGPEHVGTHETNGDPFFQESNLMVWYDLDQGLGGFWRIGQEAVRGELNSCFGVFTDDGLRFRSNVTGAPMVEGDRGPMHMSWGDRLRVDLDTLTLTADFPECRAKLRFEDFFPAYVIGRIKQPGANDGPTVARFGHHMEVAGRMTGDVSIGGRAVTVNALAYRDRSWGTRHWEGIRGTRWWPAVFGPDLCVHISGSVHERGLMKCNGFMFRDGQMFSMVEADVAVTLDYDAIGPRSGYARFTLDNGETHEMHHERSDAILLHVRGYSGVESIGRARLGDRVGMSNLEVCTNPLGGTALPVALLHGNAGDGFSRR